VSLEEWERARADARHAVVQRHLERPTQPAQNVLGRPQDGHLFLVAALPQADVARRYRRRALAAFAGFAAAAYALGWLLQGLFTAS
jgi:ferric-dicitrate binding protein FerR (iron transport regulator)